MKIKKLIVSVIVAILMFTYFNTTVLAANMPTVLKSLTLDMGNKATIKVKGDYIKSKSFKSDNTSIATVNNKGIVTAKKQGICNIKITVKYHKTKKAKKLATKVLITKVNVLINKNANDVKTLKKIITVQKNAGAKVDSNLNSNQYEWNKKTGRLTKIDWTDVNLLGEISFSGLKDLESLFCSSNKLTTLDLSNNEKLADLECSANQLTVLNLSKNKNLEGLACDNNDLTVLDVSKNEKLRHLQCSFNQLTTLNISKNEKLESLECAVNELKVLDVSKNEKLRHLQCSFNQLTKLDISKNEKLEGLQCIRNKLTTLDISNNDNLEHVSVDKGVNLIGLPKNCKVDYT